MINSKDIYNSLVGRTIVKVLHIYRPKNKYVKEDKYEYSICILDDGRCFEELDGEYGDNTLNFYDNIESYKQYQVDSINRIIKEE